MPEKTPQTSSSPPMAAAATRPTRSPLFINSSLNLPKSSFLAMACSLGATGNRLLVRRLDLRSFANAILQRNLSVDHELDVGFRGALASLQRRIHHLGLDVKISRSLDTELRRRRHSSLGLAR